MGLKFSAVVETGSVMQEKDWNGKQSMHGSNVIRTIAS